MIGTIGDVAILPIPPDHLEEFQQKWSGAQRSRIFTVDGIDRRNELYLTIHQPGRPTTL